MRIDAHQHFWIYNPQEYNWIDDEMSILKKDHTPKNLTKILKTNGFDGSVAVQARQSVQETNWLLSLADESPIIKAVVGWVDLRSPHIYDQLASMAAHPKLAGVRHIVQGESDDHFVLRDDFQNGIAALADFDLAYDILIFPKQLVPSIHLVEKFPKQRFVLDHIAKPLIKDGILSPWNEHIRKMAEAPNVFCKISGMVTEADWHSWGISDFEPYLDVIIEAFGINRVMFGSDWPVCTVAASYEKVIEIVQTYLDKHQFNAAEQDAFFGGNAAHFYQLQV